MSFNPQFEASVNIEASIDEVDIQRKLQRALNRIEQNLSISPRIANNLLAPFEAQARRVAANVERTLGGALKDATQQGVNGFNKVDQAAKQAVGTARLFAPALAQANGVLTRLHSQISALTAPFQQILADA